MCFFFFFLWRLFRIIDIEFRRQGTKSNLAVVQVWACLVYFTSQYNSLSLKQFYVKQNQAGKLRKIPD